jgi:hypothetical protein
MAANLGAKGRDGIPVSENGEPRQRGSETLQA